jgi:hypothetical protein
MHNVSINTRKQDRIRLDEYTILQFKESLRGELMLPDDPPYEEARKVYNALHDRRPALIVRAMGTADVISAVKFARKHDLLVAVRGGGHSIAGFATCDGGLVIDLRKMKAIRVDPEQKTVRAQSGCTWEDLNHATHAFGLATTGGIISTTGIAGLTLGGGMGYLARRCGLTCDNLLSADMVTAEGEFVTCDARREADLFWAIRGGGGNFGIVTSFNYRLHPVADIFGGPTFYPIEAEVFRNYRHMMAEAPEALGAIFGLTLGPPLPFVPEQWHGRPVAVVLTCWSGPSQEDENWRARLNDLGPVVGSYLARMPYPAINTLLDDLLPAGLRHYWKGYFSKDLSDAAIDVHIEYGSEIPCLQTATLLFPVDGACHRVSSDETAFAYRDARFATAVGPSWPDPADDTRNIEWGRAYYEALQPYSEAGGYVNFTSADDQGRVRANYRQNYDRLARIKRRYDPRNRFRLNQNIEPATEDN